MILTETSPPPVEAVSTADFAAHLRVSQGFVGDPTEDGLLGLYLRNATAAVEARISKALIRRGYKLSVEAWDRRGHLVLPIGPVDAVDSVTLVGAGSSIAVSASSLALSPHTDRQRLTGPCGAALPAIPGGHRAEITFQAGFGTSPSGVPGELAQAVLFLAAHYFENRFADGGAGNGIPAQVEALISTRQPVRL